MNYQKSLEKSTNKKRIKIGSKNYILDTERFRKFKMNVVAITAAVALSVTGLGVVKDNIKFHNEKQNISFEVIDQMRETGYQTYSYEGNWDKRYELVDGIEPFELLVYMGSDAALNILEYRGFNSWDEYAQSVGFENQYDWYNSQKEEIVNAPKKSRGSK